MCDRIRQSLNLGEILNTTAEEVRQFLQTDRVLIYRFEPNWSGTVVVESVACEYMATLGMMIHDPCFRESLIQPYLQGHIHAVSDIYTGGLTPCYAKFLAQLHVRANLVVPILQGVTPHRGVGERANQGEGESGRNVASPSHSLTHSPDLWGLLIAHHCSEPRQWQQLEIDLLKSLATQVAIAIQQSSLFEQLEAANQELQRLASIDGLTQVANRRRFDEYLDAEWRRLGREQKPLSLILCDLDYFKVYNDTYGHLAGDSCLQQVAAVLRQSLKRPADLVARYGGEEFALILPNTDARGAVLVAEAIRQGVRGLEIPHAKSPVSHYVTLSLGVATSVPTPEAIPDQLIIAADEALYQAKAEGRDRVIITRS
jgi:diguanylate cyclase (GGDEF)-like protein